METPEFRLLLRRRRFCVRKQLTRRLFTDKPVNAGKDDTRASFSNFGRDVDVAAPGVRVMSTVPVAQGEYKLRTGTSHATPHVSAAIALGWTGTEETRRGISEGILKLSANIGC